MATRKIKVPKPKKVKKVPPKVLQNQSDPYFVWLRKTQPDLFEAGGLGVQKYGGGSITLPASLIAKVKSAIDELNDRDDAYHLHYSTAMQDLTRRALNRFKGKKDIPIPLMLSEEEYDRVMRDLAVEDMDSPFERTDFSQPWWWKEEVRTAPITVSQRSTSLPPRTRELIRLEIEWYKSDRA